MESRRIQRWRWCGDRMSDGGTMGEKLSRCRSLRAAFSPARGGDSQRQYLTLVYRRLLVTAGGRIWQDDGWWLGE
ncbi:hypothetical protein PanWU01x14_091430 [Parasponia andersonii]|uniref:Uncharacterized protein n=1 Tax=Parasponia andersonii TaxID=3476 RepID=A0A2P5D7B7_PARAD|nr:hypothetical protein PanWU01x14_091430 [Parasponia andersonii]